MKALCVQQPWAGMIADEMKPIETRTWQTKYRGDILIVASKGCNKALYNKILAIYHKMGDPDMFLRIFGKALCVAELYDVKPMTDEHAEDACCDVYPGAYSWFLRNIRPVMPFEVPGKLSLFEVDFSL